MPMKKLWLALSVLLAGAACATTHRAGELEPRYVAVHNALAAMGLAQVGPLQQGSLAEGKEARLSLELSAQCNTIVAMGSGAVRDLDLTLLDPEGKSIAKDSTKDPQAVVRACIDAAGTYTLVVKMAAGTGDFMVATWAGGLGGGGAVQLAGLGKPQGAGTCDSPILLTAGNMSGSTSRGDSDSEGSCGSTGGKEVVYQLDLASRQRVTLEVDPTFDSVLYIRKGECADGEEIACNDDTTTTSSSRSNRNFSKSRIDQVLDPGTYYVFVDSGNDRGGSFKMDVALADVPSMADVCKTARVLNNGGTLSASNEQLVDNVRASCGDGAKGRDQVYRLEVPHKSRVRVTVHSDDYNPVVHVRSQCADDQSEVGCENSGYGSGDATFHAVLDPGTYYAFADSADSSEEGKYTISAEVATPGGTGVQGDACADAIPIGKGDQHIEVDTFEARDDVSGKCGGSGAPDVIYRLDVARRSRVSLRIADSEAQHIAILSRGCGDRAQEIACSAAIDEVLVPGTYYVAIDGAHQDDFGKAAFDIKVRDVGAQEAACKAAQTLADGQTINGTTAGAGDKFNTSCGGREDSQSSPDRIYKIVLPSRQRIRLELATTSWDGVLALRRACVDPPGSSGPRGAEVVCNNDSDDANHSRIEVTLDAGTYYVLVDGHQSGNEGPFSLTYKVIR
jgi:hypothetical protein